MERETEVNACLFQLAHFVLGRGEQTRTVIGLQNLTRMLGKRYCHTLESTLLRNGFKLLQKVHVSQMDSVKESYRGSISVTFRNGYGHALPSRASQ